MTAQEAEKIRRELADSLPHEMFCFQCEQTAAGTGCVWRQGVCGKKSATANLEDELTGNLVAYARCVHDAGVTSPCANASLPMLEGMFCCVTNVCFDDDAVRALIDTVRGRIDHVCSRHGLNAADYPAYDMNLVWNADEDVRSLKSLLLFGLRGMAAYAYHARMLGADSQTVDDFFFRALYELSATDDPQTLLGLVLECGRVNLECMALLDSANTSAYGDPVPTAVDLAIEPGPFIVVTGHDLADLEQILEQTDGRGVNVYTHGEMLPALAYPKLKEHPQLKGNFGTAWQNQQREFADIPAPVVWTTNCLMPPKDSYADRVFTTEVVAYPGCTHIEADENGRKDFSPVIERALELGGYPERHKMAGINGGTQVTCGFGRKTVLDNAGAIVEAVKRGDIGHFFLVGGCDGAKPGRNYYTRFVEQTPADSLVLTLACGKYRFNDLDLGEVAGFPRILDMGQCNDAYGAIQVALALADAFGCSVNELPLSFVLSWYEQKAVCVLLTLLALGVKNIYLGPDLPAFVSPTVLATLQEQFGIRPITTPEADMAEMLA